MLLRKTKNLPLKIGRHMPEVLSFTDAEQMYNLDEFTFQIVNQGDFQSKQIAVWNYLSQLSVATTLFGNSCNCMDEIEMAKCIKIALLDNPTEISKIFCNPEKLANGKTRRQHLTELDLEYDRSKWWKITHIDLANKVIHLCALLPIPIN